MRTNRDASANNAEQKKSKPKTPYQQLAAKIVEGSILGSVGISLLTPLMHATTRVTAKQKIEWRFSLKSAPALVSAVAPVTAVAYTVNQILLSLFSGAKKPSDSQIIMASIIAGSVAGVVNTPYEVIAQDKQLRTHGGGMIETAKQISRVNGPLSLMKGTAMVVGREGSWAATYMSLTPILSQSIQLYGYHNQAADAMAALIVGSAFGIISTPLFVLRFEKQKGLTEPKLNETYWSIAKRNGIKGLFAPVFPRTLTMIAAAAIFSKGAELMKEYSPLSNR